MFPYFGRKRKIAGEYPAPLHEVVIEPFAGSMAYTLHYKPDMAMGVEKDERVVRLWERCCELDPWTCDRIMPAPKVGTTSDDILAKLMTFSDHALTTEGPMTVTTRMVRSWKTTIRQMSLSAQYVRGHVEYRCGDYRDAPDIEATWFVDPPYEMLRNKGRGYLYGADAIDYRELAEWCKSRSGQVIVCEQAGASWLPFEPLAVLQTRSAVSMEMVWIR